MVGEKEGFGVRTADGMMGDEAEVEGKDEGGETEDDRV